MHKPASAIHRIGTSALKGVLNLFGGEQQRRIEESAGELGTARDGIAERDHRIEALAGELETARDGIAERDARVKRLGLAYLALRREQAILERAHISASRRLTAPLRSVKKLCLAAVHLPRLIGKGTLAALGSNRGVVEEGSPQSAVQQCDAEVERFDWEFTGCDLPKSNVSQQIIQEGSCRPPRLMAWYLPQFHPIPENDRWWAKGFTEWHNVVRAQQQFNGHYQPHLPADLGFYDLRVSETRKHQAELARQHGIHGFVYHYYWFNGRKVLEQPLEAVVRTGKPDFPFCISWANENWTRRWDGKEQDVLLHQEHNFENDCRFIQDVMPILKDPRYITCEDKPLLLVYRADLLAEPARTAEAWREEALRAGLPGLHLCAVRYHVLDPRPLGFDALVEFPPHHVRIPRLNPKSLGADPRFTGNIFDYVRYAQLLSQPVNTDFIFYRGVMPGWDNAARRGRNGQVFQGSTPTIYEDWLRSACEQSMSNNKEPSRFVFINAWNEWAEGTHLEPDQKFGRAYLEATRRVVQGLSSRAGLSEPSRATEAALSRMAQVKPNVRGLRHTPIQSRSGVGEGGDHSAHSTSRVPALPAPQLANQVRWNPARERETTERQLQVREREVSAAQGQLAGYERELAEARGLLEQRDRELADAQSKREEVWQQLKTERVETKRRVDRIYATYSWRITRPLRAVLDAFKSAPKKLRAVWATLSPGVGGSPKLIAFYLPQFHPIPENDEWWGKGFTEWTNVARARALYEDHHQPRRPADLGYYDLRLAEVREAQAELARAHGIHGFCYHYYWFDRRRVLERPLNDLLESGRPDFPFCLCWANESWSRRWDGSEKDILIAQNYDEGFAERFAEDAVRYLRDPRYIRIGNRPLLIVYRLDQIPDPERVVATWRQVFRDQGVGEVFLGAVECFDMTNPTRFGFDAAIEFPPHNPPPAETSGNDPERRKRVQNLDPDFSGILRDYRDCVRSRSAMKPPGYPLFRGVMPSWDNTARAGRRAMIYHHASPEAYQEWLTAVLESAVEFSTPHEPVVFVNAWNEWAEEAYLEPDDEHGHDYLLATKAALDSVGDRDTLIAPVEPQERPVVSIIIPVFNKVELTRNCLDSLHRHEAAFPFEVLVVDDGSTDDTPAVAQEMPWVRYFPQEQNRGFGAACNFGANEAKGEFLVFLNNDTTVCDGWLNALRETFDHWPGAGLVGSKLVLMDGTLQECGSLLFRDGSAANYGRGGDPRDPRYCYARETDYVSGAAIMIRNDLFHELNGFDDIYEPAYYEDTDLALRVGEMGLQVVVNPHAEVHHLEGGTAGTDRTKDIKRYQVINQGKFLERWKDVLSRFPVRPTGSPGLRKSGPRVLVVDWIIPRPDRDSASLRMAGILGALRRIDCRVTVAARDLNCGEGYELPLEQIGIEVLRRPYSETLDHYLKEEGGSFDYVILSRRDTAEIHIRSIERYCSNAKIVFDTCDLHFVREGRQAALGQSDASKQELDRMKALELDLISRSDTALVVSPQEREVLNDLLPKQDVRIVSNILDVRPTARPFSERSGLLFIGWFRHTPNVDGVLWFVRDVLPELVRRGLEPVFDVVGSDPPAELLALESEQIRIHGFVRDVEPLFDSCRLSVAPLRYGAGVKGKITQSMALGVPCVTTSVGAEGLLVEDGVHCLVADEPAAFASRIHEACQSEELWTTLRDQGLRNIEANFSPKVAEAALRDLIQAPVT